MKKLSKFQKKLHNVFGTLDTDVDISVMYRALYGQTCLSSREMQQRMAATIKRINDKLDATHIVPGNLKQTYRITRK